MCYQILTHYLFYNNGIENIKNRIKKKVSWKFRGIFSLFCRKKVLKKKCYTYILRIAIAKDVMCHKKNVYDHP